MLPSFRNWPEGEILKAREPPDKLMGVQARVCLVTGAGRGIGRAVAKRLSADGHKLALAARSGPELDDLASELGGPALAVRTDVTSADDVESLFVAVEQHFGVVEILVTSAGAATSGPFARTTDDDWQAALDLNLTGTFRCMRRAVPGMVAGGYGRIVAVASLAAKRGERFIAPYTASKHGVLGLVRAVAAELATTGVTVNAVCPGFVDTPMTDGNVAFVSARTGRPAQEIRSLLEAVQPIGRLITPEEVAEAVAYLVGSGAVSGQGLNIDGGALQS
jgi:NAD(P)-dependent dehydrogenase (short-subunit alcohol dehydrogenase family)